MTFLIYIAAGIVAGIMAGLFGIGGGMIIVPVLVMTFAAQGIAPEVLTHIALATSLATIVFTSISSVREHNKHGAIDWKLAGQLSVGIVVGTILGVILLVDVEGRTLQIAIGVFAWLMAAKMAFNLNPKPTRTVPGSAGLAASGSAIGFGSAWFGIGGGSFTVPYLTWCNVPMKKAVAIGAACGLPVALTGAISNIIAGWGHEQLPEWSTGFVYWPAVAGIALTSVPAAKVGAKLAHKLDPDVLKKAFAALLVLVGIKFLFF